MSPGRGPRRIAGGEETWEAPSSRSISVIAPISRHKAVPLDSKAFSREALDLLMGYHWPGNIRELESTVSRAALSAPGRIIRGTDIEFLHANTAAPLPAGDRMPSLAEAERAHIVRVLEAVQWNKKEASRVLDISRGTLYRKIVEFSLAPESRTSAGRRGRDEES